mmetsp:Transcript_12293/g.10919  ORF Transcript_12293/g.10919 Transcript_12293/m.10919 type:complete len:163 (-) Transcript_12293:55-543(-)
MYHIKEYENDDCSGDIKYARSEVCDENYGCYCGEEMCDPNNFMVFEIGHIPSIFYNDTTASDECDYISSHFLIKDTCLTVTGDFVTRFEKFMNVSEPQSYMAYCDEDEQKVFYQFWDNKDCSGEGLKDEPAVVFYPDIYEDQGNPEFCAGIICEDYELTDFN